MSDAHDHDHAPIQEAGGPISEDELLETAVRELLIEKGLFTAADVTRQIEDWDSRTPTDGSRFVAKVWSDPDFRKAALENGKEAAASIGIDTVLSPDLVILENTPELHHLVVCTLCSCYPRAVLGSPPAWYKSANYRARVVRESRSVLAEFGTALGADIEVRVHDSTADMRYIVLPLRPAGAEGLSEARLAELVTRDSMIGVATARSPREAAPQAAG